jgi:hypothetical protein
LAAAAIHQVGGIKIAGQRQKAEKRGKIPGQTYGAVSGTSPLLRMGWAMIFFFFFSSY